MNYSGHIHLNLIMGYVHIDVRLDSAVVLVERLTRNSKGGGGSRVLPSGKYCFHILIRGNGTMHYQACRQICIINKSKINTMGCRQIDDLSALSVTELGILSLILSLI